MCHLRLCEQNQILTCITVVGTVSEGKKTCKTIRILPSVLCPDIISLLNTLT
jgi:hypothetical protein